MTPIETAVGVPADVLRRRPDVRRAERQLAAETARIGVATAELYPKLSLSGSIGLESTSLASLFTGGSQVFGIGPSFRWNLFNAGQVRQEIAVQTAIQEEALLSYETGVLEALEEVENAITAYTNEQVRRQSLLNAAAAADRSVKLAEDRYRSGLTDFLLVLDAQRSLLTLQDQLTESEGEITSNLIRLYKALGGGWTALEPQLATDRS
jgi:NodT family efflux transporter outer membrane factor (OMF) lipoprotein